MQQIQTRIPSGPSAANSSRVLPGSKPEIVSLAYAVCFTCVGHEHGMTVLALSDSLGSEGGS
eukprot:1902242-Alexandrium_andersonii.AAC.1